MALSLNFISLQFTLPSIKFYASLMWLMIDLLILTITWVMVCLVRQSILLVFLISVLLLVG